MYDDTDEIIGIGDEKEKVNPEEYESDSEDTSRYIVPPTNLEKALEDEKLEERPE